jgi:hypothetical protein
LTAVYSLFIAAFIFGGAYLAGKLLPDIESRLELTIVFSGLLFVLIICCTVFHPSAKIFSQSSSVNVGELFFSFIIITIIFLMGIFVPRIYKLFKK